MKTMTKQERIASLKARLTDLDEWLDKHRGQQRELPVFEKNRGLAHDLRKQICKLRDPEMFARVYQ